MTQRPNEVRPPEQDPALRPETVFEQASPEESPRPTTEQERLRELEAEQIERKILEAEHLPVEPAREAPGGAAPPPAPARQIDAVTQAVEDILSEDLGVMYSQMTPKQQEIFRREGERAAGRIRQLLDHAKLKVSSLLDVIRKWLRLIPGVNKFFLEQEAKIKADKVMALHNQLHGPER